MKSKGYVFRVPGCELKLGSAFYKANTRSAQPETRNDMPNPIPQHSRTPV